MDLHVVEVPRDLGLPASQQVKKDNGKVRPRLLVYFIIHVLSSLQSGIEPVSAYGSRNIRPERPPVIQPMPLRRQYWYACRRTLRGCKPIAWITMIMAAIAHHERRFVRSIAASISANGHHPVNNGPVPDHCSGDCGRLDPGEPALGEVMQERKSSSRFIEGCRLSGAASRAAFAHERRCHPQTQAGQLQRECPRYARSSRCLSDKQRYALKTDPTGC